MLVLGARGVLGCRAACQEVVRWERAAHRRATGWTLVARGFDPVLPVVFGAADGCFNLLIILDWISAHGGGIVSLVKEPMLILHRV